MNTLPLSPNPFSAKPLIMASPADSPFPMSLGPVKTSHRSLYLGSGCEFVSTNGMPAFLIFLSEGMIAPASAGQRTIAAGLSAIAWSTCEAWSAALKLLIFTSRFNPASVAACLNARKCKAQYEHSSVTVRRMTLDPFAAAAAGRTGCHSSPDSTEVSKSAPCFRIFIVSSLGTLEKGNTEAADTPGALLLPFVDPRIGDWLAAGGDELTKQIARLSVRKDDNEENKTVGEQDPSRSSADETKSVIEYAQHERPG